MIVPETADADCDEALLDQVIDFVNANEYGLRNSLWTGSAEIIERCVLEIRNGGLLKINPPGAAMTASAGSALSGLW